MGWNIYRTIIRLNRTDPADAEADAGTGFALLVALPFAVVLIVNPRLYDSWIILNESGIACRKGGKEVWSHEWHNIATLKRSNRFRLPSVEVILYDAKGEQAPFALPDHYFRLSKKAKQAMEQYYKRPYTGP